jgi:hypothetical protein
MREHDENPRGESGVHRLAALLRKDATQVVDEDRERLAWQRLLLASHEDDEERMRAPSFRRRWLLAPAAAGLLVLAGALSHVIFTPPRLQFQVDGHGPSDAYLMAEVGRPRRLDFSDGSNLVLHASSRLRITGTDADGATLSLERGQLDLSIRHRASTHWQLDVGPYIVQVTGTHFGASWDPDSGDVGVDLLDGSVTIRGPGIAAAVSLQVGQRFRANRSGSYTVQTRPATEAIAPAQPSDARAPEPAFPAPRAKPLPWKPSERSHAFARAGSIGQNPAPQVRPSSPYEAAATGSRQEKPSCDWAGLVSSGQFEATLAQARRLGLDNALVDCPTRSLFALADAARYQGKFDLSRRALMAIRKRSPDDASKAAFFLGRLEEARGDSEAALVWYSRAMQGKTDLQFVEEAKAGKARVGKRLGAAPSQPSGSP